MITLEQACERFQTIQEVANTIANRPETGYYNPKEDMRNLAKCIVDLSYTLRQLYDLTGGFPHGEQTPTKNSTPP